MFCYIYTLSDLKIGFRFKQLLRKLTVDFPKCLKDLSTDQNPSFLLNKPCRRPQMTVLSINVAFFIVWCVGSICSCLYREVHKEWFAISISIISKYLYSTFCRHRFPFPSCSQPFLILILLPLNINHQIIATKDKIGS